MRPVLALPLSWRRAVTADRDWAYALKRVALKPYIEQTWGPWHEEQQQAWFTTGFRPEEMKVIQCDGADIGSLELHEREDHHYLAGLYLLPEAQGRGHGTRLIRQLIRQAHAAHQPLRLQVLKVNPARHLYTRLGFRLTSETRTHFIMESEKLKLA